MPESTESRHPIRVVAQRTGLSTPVLRAWERRYGVVTPRRSEGGQRLYSDDDIRRLQLLATAVDGGRSIGLIAELDLPQLEALIDEDRETPIHPIGDFVAPDVERVKTALDLIDQMRTDDLEQFFMRCAVELRPHELVEGLMVPLLQEIGRGWQAGRLGPSTEHIASVAIRRFLEWMSSTNQKDTNAPLALTGTPAGQRHEFGALLAGVVAAYEGWRVRFMGPDLPASEIARAADKLGARMVALSAVHPRLDATGVQEVLEIRRRLPLSVKVVIGGAGADAHRERWRDAGIVSPPSFSDFRDSLRVPDDAN
ncbi:MAG: MerR family transcriptional regulator [Gemmatimonadota bacterium]|nr:MerR family transcriptional regulator [Gemmatimonadota bacterium]MDE3006253.1 MerR family transcriptional regulator [Gemmatimonadota bacterium]MDE3014041.1 MerR family transcriptional regulator [Gemmatimonadota bacterium]